MSKKVTIEGYVYEVDWCDGTKEYRFMSSDRASDKWYSLIGPVSFEYTIPDGFDPRIPKLAALDDKEQQLKADFAKAMMELADDRAKLLAITNEVPA